MQKKGKKRGIGVGVANRQQKFYGQSVGLKEGSVEKRIGLEGFGIEKGGFETPRQPEIKATK